MSALPRASVALGLVASLMAGASALATEAGQTAAPQPEAVTAGTASPETEAAVALVSNGVAPKAQTDPSCPAVSIAPEGAARSADGAKSTLDGLARDCANLGAETIVKVALVGESERKKEKGAAAFDAPMTIEIRDAHGRGVETRRVNLKLEMAEGVQRVSFRHVEENVSLPPPTAEGYANWTIVVGLDPSSDPVDTAAVVDEEQVEAPAKAARSGKSRRSRYARSRSVRVKAVNTARLAATTTTAQTPITLTAKPPAAPAAIVTMTTTGSGSPMTRVAESSRSIRDKATYDRQVQALQQQRAARGLPPVPTSAIRRQGEQAQQQRPSAPVRRPAAQPAARSAAAAQVQTTQTN